jgi:hypothetical protein
VLWLSGKGPIDSGKETYYFSNFFLGATLGLETECCGPLNFPAQNTF